MCCYEIEIGTPAGDITIGVRLWLEEGKDISVYHVELGNADAAWTDLAAIIKENNISSKKLMATLAAIVSEFLDDCPWAFLLAEESRFVEASLLQTGIDFILETVPGYFVAYGRRYGQWDNFIKGVVYEAFTIRRRFAGVRNTGPALTR